MKKYPLNQKIPPITIGFLKSYENFKKLLVSSELTVPYDSSLNMLLIYSISSELTRITCYSVKSHEIWKLKIIYNTGSKEALKNTTKYLLNYKLIHTTGISEKKGKFSVEYYILPHKNWEEGITLTDLISKNYDVVQCGIETISKKPN
ncbi:hypothetical protein DSAG12_00778 [Promethearchaeum syntrophicum]|uniref:Uncharacterized protein n=1 Tax=Promethearchaeum syntrophicum TaxID=2594042 RepID=A0A5B9D7J6_9ARCH|nr:hypothetical protein [Candidatus Prometheoarchaeum syntrophicum]QEE14955.1 hypothetical protein DSAG12_00778 [Candidatus Prometheoarchaeum syntrophicum]